ncbi:hypothetical protein SCHPADRAFT_892292 [Schizopora paradoxa]|uniref:Uncharacterized protein n=1 Tax=Schizopora paradoxa TaxID=27342 RepID=A0A0H2RG30_9AGAM|nr:hypothetical protein SCHPADRAFT_892292 [Schizopora paradoxa]
MDFGPRVSVYMKPSVNEKQDIPLSSLSFLDELQRDDITYSYASSWSSNYTMSNLVGAGRIIGNIYSRAGSSLERGLKSFAYRAGIGRYVKLAKYGLYEMFKSKDPRDHKKACEILLSSAKSSDVGKQLRSFEDILLWFVLSPSKVHSAFNGAFESRNELGEAITFSWRRPGVDYSIEWLYYYKLTSRCLESHRGSFVEATTQFDGAEFQSLDFSHFEGLLSSCGYWNCRGIEDYVQNKGFDDLALVNLATGLITSWELYFSQPETEDGSFSCFRPTYLSFGFILGMTRSLQKVDIGQNDELLEYDARLAVWVATFKLHHILRSSSYYAKHSKERTPIARLVWEDLCVESHPSPKHAELRRNLLRLEDVYGRVMRKRFPPSAESLLYREEKFEAELSLPIPRLVACAYCSDPKGRALDLKRLYWHMPGWYSDRLRSCYEIMVVIERCVLYDKSTCYFCRSHLLNRTRESRSERL